MKRPRTYAGWLIDIEGVLVRDKAYTAVAGVPQWLAALQERGDPFCLVSNNTTHRPAELIAALNRAGYDLAPEHLVGALDLGRRWLAERDRRRLLWLGTAHLRSFWSEAGFELVDGGDAQAVVLGVNGDLQVADLDAALEPLRDHGADLVCLHRNPFFLDRTGRRRLGPGAWAAALEPLVDGGRVVTIGKPELPIYEAALKRLGVPAENTLFISDDPVADLVTAGRLGMGTAFVLSGKYGDHGVLGRLPEDAWPDIICATCADLEPKAGS